MAVVAQPTNLFSAAFASSGDKTIIPSTGGETTGKASLTNGFPPITSKPFATGGIAPDRKDFNGILNMLSAFAVFAQSGGIFTYSATQLYSNPAIVAYSGVLYFCLKDNGPGTTNGVITPGNDKTCWVLLNDPLAGHPIGSIYESTVDTSPADLFGGTWETMPAGEVLISAGKAASGSTYVAGKPYGNETHSLSVNELAAHNHTAYSDSQGNHYHTAYSDSQGYHGHGAYSDTQGNHYHGSGWGETTTEGTPIYGWYETSNSNFGADGNDWDNSITQTSTNGAHGHNITINGNGSHAHNIYVNYSGSHAHNIYTNNTGSGAAFSIMQPSRAVYRWTRTA